MTIIEKILLRIMYASITTSVMHNSQYEWLTSIIIIYIYFFFKLALGLSTGGAKKRSDYIYTVLNEGEQCGNKELLILCHT